MVVRDAARAALHLSGPLRVLVISVLARAISFFTLMAKPNVFKLAVVELPEMSRLICQFTISDGTADPIPALIECGFVQSVRFQFSVECTSQRLPSIFSSCCGLDSGNRITTWIGCLGETRLPQYYPRCSGFRYFLLVQKFSLYFHRLLQGYRRQARCLPKDLPQP